MKELNDNISVQSRAKKGWEGKVVGAKYRLLEQIGTGSFATIYKAQHIELNTFFAIKILHPIFINHREVVERFFREARAASQLKHENVVFIADFAHDPQLGPYIVMEYLEGETLKARLKREAPFPLQLVGEISFQICKALATAHNKSIIHRDLKPENIFLVNRQFFPLVKILDFGIAHLGTSHDAITGSRMMGTPAYMAPEQFRGETRVKSIDIYSFGVILYEMLTGSTPFSGHSVQQLGIEHLLKPPPELDERFPPALRELQKSLLAKIPEDRPQSFEEVWFLLSRALDPEKRFPHWHIDTRQLSSPPEEYADEDLLSEEDLIPEEEESELYQTYEEFSRTPSGQNQKGLSIPLPKLDSVPPERHRESDGHPSTPPREIQPSNVSSLREIFSPESNRVSAISPQNNPFKNLSGLGGGQLVGKSAGGPATPSRGVPGFPQTGRPSDSISAPPSELGPSPTERAPALDMNSAQPGGAFAESREAEPLEGRDFSKVEEEGEKNFFIGLLKGFWRNIERMSSREKRLLALIWIGVFIVCIGVYLLISTELKSPPQSAPKERAETSSSLKMEKLPPAPKD